MTKLRITVKKAIKIATESLMSTYNLSPLARPRLEETVLDEKGHWFITVSFTEPGIFDQREYKIFEIDSQTGSVIAMRIRQLLSVDGGEF